MREEEKPGLEEMGWGVERGAGLTQKDSIQMQSKSKTPHLSQQTTIHLGGSTRAGAQPSSLCVPMAWTLLISFRPMARKNSPRAVLGTVR